jgi:hypothetical protein
MLRGGRCESAGDRAGTGYAQSFLQLVLLIWLARTLSAILNGAVR